MAQYYPRRGLAFGRIIKAGNGHGYSAHGGENRLTGTGDMVTRLLSRGIAVTIIPEPGILP